MHVSYWPPGVPRDYSLDAYEQAYATLGFVKCSDETYEARVTRIALFAKGLQPTHASRQISPDQWTSKLGQDVDISHHLHGVSGDTYGNPVAFLCRFE
jgi:hypothetical protein